MALLNTGKVPRALGFKECPKGRFYMIFRGGVIFQNKLLRFCLWGDGLGPGGARAQAPRSRGPGPRAQRASRAQSIAELYIYFHVFVIMFRPFLKKCMNMVDEDGWIFEFGVGMIPNDRPRSSLGPPGDFGKTNPKVFQQIQLFRHIDRPKSPNL